METKYYFPINSASLAYYFGCACIKPSKYFENKQEDLQDKFNDFLLVTTHFGTQQTDCCLELVFTEQETAELISVQNDFFLFEKPLPITRVRKIYFSNKEQKELTITNINMSDAFILDELVEIKEFDNVQVNNLEKPQDIHTIPYNEQLKRFNGFLGGLALMRLAGEEYMNYSENYFATLAFFNTVIQQDLQNSKINIDKPSRYHDAFTGKGNFKEIFPYLNKTINETDVNNIAQEENQIIKKDRITRIIDLNTLDKWTYTVAVLNTYGVRNESKKKKVDELILSNFKSEIKPGKSEGIALCYGLNRGYSAFSNKYNLGKNEKIVKFQLNSQLDYYTIESIYQYAFNNIKSDKFVYLDDWCPKQKWSKISKKTNYMILDVTVIGKKKAKVSSIEYLENLLLQFFQKDKAPLFRGLIEKVREIIYNDAKDEIADDYENQLAQKEEEISKLKIEQKELLESPNSVPVKKYNEFVEETTQIVAEPRIEYNSQNIDRNLFLTVLKNYRNKKRITIEKEAEKDDVSFDKSISDEELILKIVEKKRQHLFNE